MELFLSTYHRQFTQRSDKQTSNQTMT